LIPNFVTYLARIVKAEAGSIEPEKLEVIPVRKRNHKTDAGSRGSFLSGGHHHGRFYRHGPGFTESYRI
jgi:hypothetical protein